MSNEQDKSREDRTEKAISWKSLVLRVIGGYFLFGIASQIIDPDLVGHNYTPAQTFVSLAFGYLLRYLAVLIVFSIIAFLIARVPAKNRTKPLPPFLNGAFIGTLVVSAFLVYGGWHGEKMAAELSRINLNRYDSTTSTETAKVIAVITSQNSDGVTTTDLDQDGLKNLESWIVQTLLEKGKSHYSELGFDPKNYNPEVIASSVYINVGGKKLAVIKVSMGNAVRAVTIIGIEGGELVRVGCIRNSNHDISLFSGECGAKIQEAFGVPIKPR